MHTRAHIRAWTQKPPVIDSYQPPDKVLSCQGYNIFTGGSSLLFSLQCGSQGLLHRSTALPSSATRGYLHCRQRPLTPGRPVLASLVLSWQLVTHTVTLRFALKQQPFTSAGLVHLLLQLNFANEVDSGNIQNDSARLGTCHFSIAVLTAVQILIPLVQEMPPAFFLMLGFSAEVFTEARRPKMSSGCKIRNWIPTLDKITVGSFPCSSCSALNLMFPGIMALFPPQPHSLGRNLPPSLTELTRLCSRLAIISYLMSTQFWVNLS